MGVVNAVDDKPSFVLTIDCVRVVDTLKVTVEDENVDVEDENADVSPCRKHPMSSISVQQSLNW